MHIFRCLGRYTRRVALSNACLMAADAARVTVATKDGGSVTVTPRELMRRFLQHVLPTGLSKIRHVGLYALSHVEGRLATARKLAAPDGEEVVSPLAPHASTDDAPAASREDILKMLFGPELLTCPRCQLGRMRLMAPIAATTRAKGPAP